MHLNIFTTTDFENEIYFMENEVIEQEQPEVVDEKKNVVASVGKPVRADYTAATQQTQTEVIEAKAEPIEAEVTEIVNNEAQPEAVANQEQPETTAELSDEQLRELYEKRFPVQLEQTPEQKIQQKTAERKPLLDEYLKTGRTIEEFARLTELADGAVDLEELGRQAIIAGIKKGNPDADASEYLAKKYPIVDIESLVIDEDDETDDEFEARKQAVAKENAINKAELLSRGETVKKQAETILNTLKEAIDQTDSEAKMENDFIAKVNDLPKELPKNITLELGKLKDKDLGSVQVDVSESDIAEVVDTLKDPAKRKQLLFNEDDSINEKSIANLLLRNKLLEKAVRSGWDSGSNAQSEIVNTIFPNRNPNAIGVGGAPRQAEIDKTRVASIGKPQRVNSGR